MSCRPPHLSPGTRPRVDLHRLLAIGAACAQQPPYNGRGRAGQPLIYDAAMSLWPTNQTTWMVQFTEDRPLKQPYGVELSIELSTGLCDGHPLAIELPPAPGLDADAIVACARACVPHGRGVTGRPLDFEAPRLFYLEHGAKFGVTFFEKVPKGLGTGLNINVASDASGCRLTMME